MRRFDRILAIAAPVAFLTMLLAFAPGCAEDSIAPPTDDNPGTHDEGTTPSAEPRIHVATDGSDTPTCGGEGTPCRTIRHAMGLASAGSEVYVHPGTYQESWIQVRSGVSLVSSDGPAVTQIYSGDRSAVRFENVSDARLEGFEVYADWNQGPEGDGLVRVTDASNITIWGCILHDAPFDCDVIKVSGDVDGLLLRSLVVWNPGARPQGTNPCGSGPWYQENVDIFGRGLPDGTPGVRNVSVRGCWFFHTPEVSGDWLIYSKINSGNILYENNVFGPSAGSGCQNPAVGVGTGEAGIPDPGDYVVEHAIVRNNVFVGLKGAAALGILNSNDVWVYNNTFWNNDDLLAVIELRGNTRALGDVRIFNNLFQDNDAGRFFWVRNGLPSTFVHDSNLYFDNVTGSDTPYTGEANSLYDVDPMLAAPRIPSLGSPSLQSIVDIARDFMVQSGSPVIDEGQRVTAMSGHPDWNPVETGREWDLFCRPRPGGAWDIGAHERIDP